MLPCSCECCKRHIETIEAREERIRQLEEDAKELRAEAKHAKIQLSIFKISGKECRNKDNI